mmetsp:Transcript_7370/g.20410  ORF Transcript_7370/g.20410 Transcript_7370/m.20410 type:complete len:85 (+) Transcript_7370:105-359(+)
MLGGAACCSGVRREKSAAPGAHPILKEKALLSEGPGPEASSSPAIWQPISAQSGREHVRLAQYQCQNSVCRVHCLDAIVLATDI